MITWQFDRYRTDHYGNRRLMAEGAIVHADDFPAALQKARYLFQDCPDDELVLRNESALKEVEG